MVELDRALHKMIMIIYSNVEIWLCLWLMLMVDGCIYTSHNIYDYNYIVYYL